MPQTIFTALAPAKPDPIFAINQEAKAVGLQAINLTVGTFLSEDGKEILFSSVQKAITEISATLPDRYYGYPPLTGLHEFRSSVTKLIFGETNQQVASIATTGGTGAVAINLRLLKLLDEEIRIIVPSPTWANHWNLLRSAGIETIEVPYLEDGRPTIDGIREALSKTQGPTAILLHVGCHNPTGLDFSSEQWNELVPLLSEHSCTALLDFAYQGFASEPEEDALPIQLFLKSGAPFLVAWSASKNHSLYSERVGLACAIMKDEELQKKIEGHFMILTRGLHSASATFGQSVVARVQMHHEKEWLEDVSNARSVMMRKRESLIAALPKRFSESLHGSGMFACLPLSPNEIEALKKEHKVFLTNDGRINIAGLALARIDEFAQKLRSL